MGGLPASVIRGGTLTTCRNIRERARDQNNNWAAARRAPARCVAADFCDTELVPISAHVSARPMGVNPVAPRCRGMWCIHILERCRFAIPLGRALSLIGRFSRTGIAEARLARGCAPLPRLDAMLGSTLPCHPLFCPDAAFHACGCLQLAADPRPPCALPRSQGEWRDFNESRVGIVHVTEVLSDEVSFLLVPGSSTVLYFYASRTIILVRSPENLTRQDFPGWAAAAVRARFGVLVAGLGSRGAADPVAALAEAARLHEPRVALPLCLVLGCACRVSDLHACTSIYSCTCRLFACLGRNSWSTRCLGCG